MGENNVFLFGNCVFSSSAASDNVVARGWCHLRTQFDKCSGVNLSKYGSEGHHIPICPPPDKALQTVALNPKVMCLGWW